MFPIGIFIQGVMPNLQMEPTRDGSWTRAAHSGRWADTIYLEAWKQLQPTIDRISPLAVERGIAALSDAERSVLLVWVISGRDQ